MPLPIRLSVVLLFVFAGFLTVSAQPVDPDIVVAADGSGDYATIQEAIDAAPSAGSTPTVIYIKRGLYNTQKLMVPADKTNLWLIGESREETVISYHIYDCTGGFNGKCPAEDAMLWDTQNITTSATLTIFGQGFRAENLTIQNTAGPVGQALAITVRTDKVVFLNCDIKSYQDTVYLWHPTNRVYFRGCLIVGRTDYIYGASVGYFHNCEIRSWGGGWITAPSTPLNQPYGFVFYGCRLTYALNSPRAGDDGHPVAFGRPWQNYPKVAWLYCDMTEKIHPLGWPDIWNMAYASTSTDLHLYEYANTGPGADMSNRANWAGLRALTDQEAPDYTAQVVMAGNDGWDPTAIQPVVPVYKWTGEGATTGWLETGNWDLPGAPAVGEAAYADSLFLITATGGDFEADLTLSNGATLEIAANSSVTYLAVSGAMISCSGDGALGGKVNVKDTTILAVPGDLDLGAVLTGSGVLRKTGAGSVVLSGENAAFTGNWILEEGLLSAASARSLGQSGRVVLASSATLYVGNDTAFYLQTVLETAVGSSLALDADIILSEFYLDGILQSPGEYTSSTNPGTITGTGKVIVQRPSTFVFVGGPSNGNWDNPAHYLPALLPEAGETVLVEKEIETTSYVYTADMVVSGAGRVRLRGVHTSTGAITLNAGTSLRYATSGTGFTLNAPLIVTGDISLQMSSANTAGSTMTLSGPIAGSSVITARNTRSDVANTGWVALTGDNNAFSGTWDLTVAGSNVNGVAAFDGQVANAFGHGTIDVGSPNRVLLSHEKCAGDTLRLNISGSGMATLNAAVMVDALYLNGIQRAPGVYDANTDPELLEGFGSITVGEPLAAGEQKMDGPLVVAGNRLIVKGLESTVILFHINGVQAIRGSSAKEINLEGLAPGVYIAVYQVDGKWGAVKVPVGAGR